MRLLRVMVPVLLALAMVVGMAGVAVAQDAPEATPEAGLPEGLEKWYARNFSVDLESLFATPTDDAAPSGWLALSTNVVSFATEEQAAEATDDLLQQLEEVTGGENVVVEDVELDTRLDSTAKVSTEEIEGVSTSVIQAVVQDGVYVYLVVGFAADTDQTDLITTVLDTMADAAADEGEEAFDSSGGSQGGLWNKLPTAEMIQEEVPSLTVVEDVIFYPVPEPEATPAS